MTHTLVQNFEKKQTKQDLPQLRSGLTVRIHQKITEGDKTRIQIFEGLIIKHKGNGGLNTTITVRKNSGNIGVEKIFNIHSHLIANIEIKQIFKVRRNYLSYLRERTGKAAKLREIRK